ncbi:MAG TPA: branched-chain amino acid ABC transporter ATP-binding protein/permease [Streptosporangiaceae bacterium]|nr:branched-chain amino acid ABC transporter ATP-binding protein/permease [Streptosporangiaceae bacterium]
MSDAVRRLRPRRAAAVPAAAEAWSRTWPWWVVVVLAGIALPVASGTSYAYFEAAGVGIYALVGIGMNLLYGLGGQASLGQGGIVAIGAYGAGMLIVHVGWGLWPAAIAATLIGMVTGIVMGLPALRLSTWYFALASLAFSAAVVGIIDYWQNATGGVNGLVGIGENVSSQDLYWVVLVINALGLLLYSTFANSRLGRGLIAVKAGGEAATISGVRIVRLKLTVFAVSGAYAGAAGAIFAIAQQVISPSDFTSDFSIFFIVIVVAGGAGRLLGPVVGAMVFFAVPDLLTSLQSWREVIYGGVLLAFMAFAPDGIMGALERVAAAVWPARWKLPGRPGTAGPAAAGGRASELPRIAADRRTSIADVVRVPGAGKSGRLVVDQVTMAFGGLHALEDVSMVLEPGSINGLVGPNGSGKTTLLNVITSLYIPSRGRVSLGDTLLTGTPPARLASLGVARTFQTPRLLPELSVWENVMLGGSSVERATTAEILLRLPRARREARELGQRAVELLRPLGLAGRAGQRAGDLPHGHQRMVEIARALMAHPRLLLLDEPAAGLSSEELGLLHELVRQLSGSGMTILIVEHHIGWIRDVCQAVTVLDRGKIVLSGEPDDVFADARVRQTYLGVVV